jgi:hypothetical protein
VDHDSAGVPQPQQALLQGHHPLRCLNGNHQGHYQSHPPSNH